MSGYMISYLGCLLLPVLMIVFALWGYRVGRRRLERDPDEKDTGTGVVDAAVLSLLGLLIAFTFSNAYARYDTRPDLIVQEANAIGTAYLRLDLLPADARPSLKKLMRTYTESRLEMWRLFPDRAAALAELAHAEQLQKDIWDQAVNATNNPGYHTSRMLVLPALNEMIDLSTTRLIAVQAHAPSLIYLQLGILALAAAWLNGFGMRKTERISYPHIMAFAVFVGLSLYVVVDMEYPRFGLITLDQPHELFAILAQTMK